VQREEGVEPPLFLWLHLFNFFLGKLTLPVAPTAGTLSMSAPSPQKQAEAEREKQWTAYWAPKMCVNDGSQSQMEFEASILREKKLWWLRTFNEPYTPVKNSR